LRDGDERRLQDQDRQPDADGKDERAVERCGDLAAVAGTECLGDEAGGAGAQEVERQEDDVEDQPADRDAADQRRVAELADDAEIDDADERRLR